MGTIASLYESTSRPHAHRGGAESPESIDGLNEEQIAPFKPEWMRLVGPEKMGHEVQKLELHNEPAPVRCGQYFKPQIAFNLMEGFEAIRFTISMSSAI
jgi:hypothetical protein